MAVTNAAPMHADELALSLLPELKRMAKIKMRHERQNHTLQPTELVNELYLKLLRSRDFAWKDKNHFLLCASQAMRHFLVDYARERAAEKRGGDLVRLELRDASGLTTPGSDRVLDLHAALTRLATTEPRMAQVVELRFFGGLTFEEIGDVLSVNQKTAKRDWTLAREWLGNNLSGITENDSGGMGED